MYCINPFLCQLLLHHSCFCQSVLYESLLLPICVVSSLLLSICIVSVLLLVSAFVVSSLLLPICIVSMKPCFCQLFFVSFLFLVLVHAFVSLFILSFLLVSSLLWPNLLLLPSNCIVLTLACLCDCWKHESYVWIYVMLSLLWALRVNGECCKGAEIYEFLDRIVQ